MSWLRVTWTDAGQILNLCGRDSSAGLGTDPKAYFDAVVAAQDYHHAVEYLGAALPRQEAVQWAFATIRQAGGDKTDYRKQMEVSVKDWIAFPSDSTRRAAWSLASRSDENSPERLLACAVYFSGGSIAPEDCDPVQPEPHLCGTLAATAILACASLSETDETILRDAVSEGDRLASS